MKRIKNVITAIFFLVSFMGCIGINCARNIAILKNSGCNANFETYTGPSVVKANVAATAYLLMDKKENDSQKYACNQFLSSLSVLSHTFIIAWNIKTIVKACGVISIYTAIHNYRI